ncbi:MAG: hypothetical protein COV46_08910 [Deltaproteobacteria bacterium CG11_big_fil_rev_8_21_14_0_20_49_13]|nr:MAG: hypothetical protein COV46_08910 [Deltaproteobacteria bacterium CG11_big_fil_rev_8_21_14_0_20_49_13]
MAISNISFKATEGPSTEAALEMKAKLKAAVKQIDEAEGYSSYLTVGEKAELEKSKALLMSDLAATDYFLKTGEWLGPVLPAGATNQQSLIDMNSLEEGFWLLNPGETVPTKLTDIDGDIFVENNKVSDGQGGYIKPKVWYVAGEDVTEITGRNVGKDIELEITHEDGTVETKLFKNGATGDYQLCINGLKSKYDMLIDMSHVAILDPATGKKGGMVIIGGKGDDTIYGTLGTDNISGAGGDDAIVGMGGGDSVYGYASTDPFVNVAGTYGAADLGADGNDDIYDIYGTDIIDAGPGAQDVVHRGYTTNTTSIPAAREEGGEPVFDPDSPGDIESWFAGSEGWKVNADGENELVLTKKDGATDSKVIMDVIGAGEEGYMVTGQRDGTTNDLILTAVKVDGGEPRYYRVRVRDYFSSDSKLTINNSVTDLGELNKDLDGVGTKAVTLNGTGLEGDILIAPKTVFDDYAVEIENLGISTNDKSQLEELLKLQKEDPTSI